jgi:hypothetical protein
MKTEHLRQHILANVIILNQKSQRQFPATRQSFGCLLFIKQMKTIVTYPALFSQPAVLR